MEQDPERWISIDPVPSRDGFGAMEAFVANLPESEQRRTLEKALAWKKPFSNFRYALRDMPELRETWLACHREIMRSAAQDWLRNSGVDAELK